MAPKKKKKAASNPARGFATVSVPSKTAISTSLVQEEEKLGTNETERTPDIQNLQAVPTQSVAVKSLAQMSPEELGAHLGKAGLQSIIDTYGKRARNDAFRQRSRLEAENRSLRSEAFRLETDNWLPPILEEVLALARQEWQQSLLVPRPEINSEVDLCVKLWAAKMTLESLQLPAGENLLRELVLISPNLIKSDPKTIIWGLDEALTWLALTSHPEDLRSYDQQQRRILYVPLNETPGVPQDLSADISRLMSLSSLDKREVFNGTRKPKSVPPQAFSQITATDDESDDDPEHLTDKYLTAKYELLKASLKSETAPDERAMTRRIERIERDPLFDQRDADIQWRGIEKDLRIDDERMTKSASGRDRSTENAANSKAEGGNQADTDETEETADLFGDLFESVDEPADLDGSSTGTKVTLREFTMASTGTSPRRVLETYCKTRDSACKVVLHKLPSLTTMNRQGIKIVWSGGKELVLASSFVPQGFACLFQDQSSIAVMESIVTPSKEQSEGYLCTVMLFLLSQATGDEKIYIRLGSTWKDLWKELLDSKQEQVDSVDREILKSIQSLISENSEPKPLVAEEAKKVEDVMMTIKPKVPVTEKQQSRQGHLSALWKNKASTPRFQDMLSTRKDLPIWQHREHILATITGNQVTVLCAETGAGKSTQIPSFILEHHMSKDEDCKILISQPRRISAMSLARRVSEELGEHRGAIGTHDSLVGYAIRLESKVSRSTRITYMTTGVLLRMLASSNDLENCNCLVLDEVHERTMDLDLIFIALRRLLKRRPSLKVVLMSATVDAAKFSSYFGDAPILNIPGRSFPVEIRYLEDAMQLTQDGSGTLIASSSRAVVEEEDVGEVDSEQVATRIENPDGYSDETIRRLARHNEYQIDYNIIAHLVLKISSSSYLSKYGRAFLIFMPGIGEIRRLNQIFMTSPGFQGGWTTHLLHSSFSNEDLDKAFLPPPPGHRKIVIATNIAETGITIPDITAVIDTCKEKIMRFDEKRQISKLTESFISRSSARQRRGRAARVQEGLCFHLVTKYRHDKLLLEHHIPEMLRLSLQEPVLRIKVLNLGDIEETLSEAFDPPTSKNIRRAVQLLKDVKALTALEALTSLGRQLAKLPLDIWLGKLVIYGVRFGCFDVAVFIAALLSTKSPFMDSNDSDGRTTVSRLAFDKGHSDLTLVYNAYSAWKRAFANGTAQTFCRKNNLSHVTLSQIEDQKVQLVVTLSDNNIISLDQTEKEDLRRCRLRGWQRAFFQMPERYSSTKDSEWSIASAIAVAVYPKLLVHEAFGWRNVVSNQHLNLAHSSVNNSRNRSVTNPLNAKTSEPPPKWIAFYQTIQTKAKNATALETTAIPELVVALLLGSDVEFKMYSGVILLDNGKIRFSVADWRTMVAIRALRTGLGDALAKSFRAKGPGGLSEVDCRWLDIWQKILLNEVERRKNTA